MIHSPTFLSPRNKKKFPNLTKYQVHGLDLVDEIKNLFLQIKRPKNQAKKFEKI